VSLLPQGAVGEPAALSFRDLAPGTSVAQARLILGAAFRAAGLDSPELDARVLIGHALGLDHAALAAAAARQLPERYAAHIGRLAARRLAREPIARILGEREFWSLPFTVTPAVLVPRPETETVVACALAALEADGARARPRRVADLGTGSGALLIALLGEMPGAFGIGTDSSLDALAVARNNAERLGLGARAAFVACDFGSALAACDLVVSNPPYVATADIAMLAPEVRDHDPRAALDGGPDGLAAYRAIAADAARLLAPGGHLIVEIGAGQAGDVAALLAAQGLSVAPARADFAGTPRALHARHAPEGSRESQKSAWNGGKDRLGSGHGIDPRTC
jgi:release factor glutamine methyltransferase